MRDATSVLLAVAVALAGSAGALLAFAPESPPSERDFQSIVGGVGAGVAPDPSRCGRAFDGGAAAGCSWRHGPVAGGDRYCPLHGFGSGR